MNRSAVLTSLALASVLAAQVPPAVAFVDVARPVPAAHPVDLAICLDISGSMNGLIDAARQNLWAVVNDLARMEPTPTLRVALLTFGCSTHDAEQGWVKVETEFTTDLDLVSQKLFALTTNGGDEYVARVTKAAVEQLAWSADPKALKLLLVAGNEAATQDPQFATEAVCKAAIGRGIVVNSIYCGDGNDQIAPAWRDVAKFADGQFAAIDHNQAVVIATPFDARLAELSASLNTTYVPYGARGGEWAQNQVAQDANAATLNTAAAAQRCQTKGSVLYGNSHWDLVDALREGKVKLAEVKREELPEALRALDAPALQQHVDAQRTRREGLQQEVTALGTQRDAFVAAELQKLGAVGEKAFAEVVRAAVRQQAEAKGLRQKPAPALATGDAPVGSAVR
jgi:hypothetical protein